MRRRFSPWDVVRTHPYARRLPVDFDSDRLAGDLGRFGDDWWHKHAGPYHDGGWESISLWAPRGDPFEQRSFGGAFSATPALLAAPYLSEVLNRFSAERNRVRLMRLGAGARIFEHRDPLHAIDPSLVRLHVPVVTNPDVVFEVGGTRVTMLPGQTWHIDVRFAHSVENRGAHARVHLVMDLVRDATLDTEMARAEAVGTGRLTGYFVTQLLPRRLRRALGVVNG